MSVFEHTPQWYNLPLPDLPAGKNDKKKPTKSTEEKYQKARQLLTEENEKAETTKRLSSSDRNFVSNILQSGTLSDKISTLTLLIQESPLHSLKTFDTLMSMAKKKSRKEAVMAVESLKDLFVGSVLPERKLVYFADQPLDNPGVTDKHLIRWAFEDFLKKYYFEFVQQVEALSHDPLLHVRYAMVRNIHGLLSGKPEQEQNLLKLLVNKLGDSENKVAAKASQMLIELLIAHPGMKPFVVREIEQLLFQPKSSERAQYYSLITLNQTILTSRDKAVANKLIEIYFIFFRRLLKISEEQDAKEESKANEEKADTKISQKESKKRKLAKAKEAQLGESQAKMIAAILTGVNRAFHFAEIADEVVEKHLETLYKITHTGTFNTAIQALSLIFSISLVKNSTADRFYRTLYESMLDPRLITSSKQTLYLNLLLKAIRADDDIKRVKAFVKRLVQIASHQYPTLTCGLFQILSQLMTAKPGLRSMLTTPEEDDEDEHFDDAPDDEDQEEGDKEAEKEAEKEADKKDEQENNNSTAEYYDGRKRDPRFARAEKSCLWELIPFKDHYHPTVAKYAELLLKGEKIDSQTDLHQHTLMHFLDKFVYKNPKKTTGTRGSSMMQPLGSRRDGGVMLTRSSTATLPPVNTEAFWRQQVENVPVDEIFFHKYFTNKVKNQEPSAKKRRLDIEEDGDEKEDEVWRAMMKSMPGGLDDLEGEDEDDDDDQEFDDDEMMALLMESEDEDE